MELAKEGNVLTLNPADRPACDQCRYVHRRCSRCFPVCQRCLRLGIECTRNQKRLKQSIFHKLAKEGWLANLSQSAPSTWKQAIAAYPADVALRFLLRRFLVPLLLVVPKPSETKGILDMCARFSSKYANFLTQRVLLQVEYPASQLQQTLAAATTIFFRCFNPFYPLFSEEGFHAKPRSSTLRKIIIQIGLENMPQTDLTKAAEIENNFQLDQVAKLPFTLDTLQCLLLTLCGIRRSKGVICLRLAFLQSRIPSFLGLHVETRHSWLERTLAMHFVHLSIYNSSIAQNTSTAQMVELDKRPKHLNPTFLPRMTNHFPHLSDRIHFIASQTMFHSFVVVNSLATELMYALKEKTPASAFASSLDRHVGLLRENFLWGWTHLSLLTQVASCHKQLLFQSRITLAIRHCNSYIELMKMALHINPNPNSSLYLESQTRTVCEYGQRGVNMAMRCIRLVSSIAPAPLGMNCVFSLVPAIAFLLAHHKALRHDFVASKQAHDSLASARAYLERAQAIPHLAFHASSYLELIDFTLARSKGSP